MTTNARIPWDEETDVVVVGYGGAGAVAAVSAGDAGADVLILEKQPADTPDKTNHTPSTRTAGGGIFSPTDVEATALYLQGLTRIANEPLDEERRKMIEVFAGYLTTGVDWMKSIGADLQQDPLYAEFPDLPGADTCKTSRCKDIGPYRNGAALFKILSEAVQQRKIPVFWESPARHFVTQNGRVTGVVAMRSGKEIRVRARRAVILTCGGFEYNEFMKQNYLKAYPAHFTGNPASTGDGINMAMEAGAALWHMNAASWRVVYKYPDFPVAFNTQLHETGTIIVDKRGNRFANERFKAHSFGYELTNYDAYARCYPKIPCYQIFDEKRRKLAPMASYHGATNPPGGVTADTNYLWDKDNQKEIDRGWIMKAGSIEELAAKIVAEPDNNGMMTAKTLADNIKRYNDLCRQGEDLDFHKPKEFMLPIEDPPYYGMKLWVGGPNTQGGPKRNERGQVMRVDNTPLPGLYAAGELGSVWGMFYQVGGNIAECIAFGRIAGTNAASEKRA